MKLIYPINKRLFTIFLVVLTGLTIWTIYLAFTLPDHFDTAYWSIAWVGFDAALITVLGFATWAAYFQKQILVAASIVAATLLICDAWFDVVMSFGSQDHLFTIAGALLVELPLAIFFIMLARRIMKRTLGVYRAMIGEDQVPEQIHNAAMIYQAKDQTDNPNLK